MWWKTTNLSHRHVVLIAILYMYTPNGYNAYIHHAGSYVVTFTLGNADEYYGEFDVIE